MAQESWSSGRPAGTQPPSHSPGRRRTDAPVEPVDGPPQPPNRPAAARGRRRGGALATVLAEAAQALLSAGDVPSIAATALEAARAILDAHGGGDFVVWVCDGDVLRAAAASSTIEAKDVPRDRLPAAVQTALNSATPVRSSGHPLTVSPGGGAATELKLHPLHAHGRLLGVLGVGRRRPCNRPAACGCDEALDALVAQAALALAGPAGTAGEAVDPQRLRSVLEHADDLVAVLSRDGRMEYVNQAGTRLLGYAPELLRQLGLAGVLHPGDVAAWRALHSTVLQAGRQTMRCRLQHADRSLRHVELRATSLLDEPSVAGVLVMIRDVTATALTEAALAHRASHDPLTDLPNRALLLERVQEAVSNPDRRGRLAVLSIDLDGFAAVNDRLGQAGGDLLLIAVAERLRDCLATATCIARLSGDEFAVLLEGLSAADLARQSEAVGNRLLMSLRAPFSVLDEPVRVGASIGVAVGIDGLEDAGDLLHRADLAMYAAKAGGRNRCHGFDPAAHETRLAQQLLQAELPNAFDRNELEVRYQPVVSLTDGSIVSAEALVRWHHPRRGLLGPGTFIPLAEEQGLVGDVFDLVLSRACRQVRRWQERLGLAAPSVAVNLSPRQLDEPDLVEHVAAVLRDARIPPSCLTLELTENVLLADPQAAALAMRALKELGVQLAIDDFGTGYSSLAYLRALPIDVLKVDKAFVDGLGSRDPSGLLARTIIDLGHRLGLKTIAEGIERPEQLELLRQIGCNYGQGYLFSRPLLGGGVDELVSSRLRDDLGVG